MMLACNQKYIVLSSSLPECEHPPIQKELVVSGKEISVYKLCDFTLMSSISLERWNIDRYLDVFYIVSLAEMKSANTHLINALLDEIADQYNDLIDVTRNVSNIEALLRLVGEHYFDVSDLTVLDFGCGTGLSLPIAEKHSCNILGFDRSLAMAEIASKNGMAMITSSDLEHEIYKFDVIIASYVMHLLSDYDMFIGALNCLKSGGIVVCNFHKNHGYEELSNLLNSEFHNSIEFINIDFCDIHGTYAVIVKH